MLLFYPILIALASAQSIVPDPSQDSPDDYAPSTNLQCPSITTAPLLRQFSAQNQTLHPQESQYVDSRAQLSLPDAWKDWLGDGSDISYNVTAFAGHHAKIGIAIPGGGLRAALYAAGCLSGLDARNTSAKAAGTGGLLQVSSYITGLSGGSWITGSLFFNNWPTSTDLVFGNGKDLSGWLLDLPLASPDGDNVFNDKNQAFYGSILWSVMAKAAKAVDTSLTDPWSRMISYHFLNQTSRDNFFTNSTAHGAGQLWSRIPEIPAYQEHTTPFPIIVANVRPGNDNLTTILSPDATVYEITPLEFGSWDPNLSAMMNLTYAGTHLNNGFPDNDTACVTGFDQAGFVMGTSASLFNQILDFATNTIQGFSNSDAAKLLYVLARQLRSVRTRADDVANWPNPFHNIRNDTYDDSKSTWLSLIDGSSNQENVPYGPLFLKPRGLDVIVTLEQSADDKVNNWPNGTGPLFTAARQSTILRSTHQQFPPIPASSADFISTGVNARPTFFGCDPVQNPPEYPLVIYLPNAPPLDGSDPVTNTATFKLAYTAKHIRLFMDQVHANTISGFTPNANTPDPNFGICLKCAAVDRTRLKLSPAPARSAMCSQCFQQYCFDPKNPPSKIELPNRKLVFVDPDPQGLSKVEGFLDKNKFGLIGGLIGLIAVLGGLIAFLLWRRKRKEAQYKRVNEIVDEDAPWKRHSGRASSASYELPEHHGGYLPEATRTS